jgi:competence protein ComEA
MSRTTSVVTAALALGLMTASLALAQTGSSQPATAQAAATQPAVHASSAKPKATAEHMMKVDINSASREELAKLPGIDDATADKIVAARPFKSKAELRSKGIVTKAEYGKIASRLMVKPAATASK